MYLKNNGWIFLLCFLIVAVSIGGLMWATTLPETDQTSDKIAGTWIMSESYLTVHLSATEQIQKENSARLGNYLILSDDNTGYAVSTVQNVWFSLPISEFQVLGPVVWTKTGENIYEITSMGNASIAVEILFDKPPFIIYQWLPPFNLVGPVADFKKWTIITNLLPNEYKESFAAELGPKVLTNTIFENLELTLQTSGDSEVLLSGSEIVYVRVR